MNAAAARILVATQSIDDAQLIRKLLRNEFDNVAVSSNPALAVEDFEKHRPEVLILAFDSLERAERYYLGLYRLSSSIHALQHRTLILCNKDDLQRVYELCKKEYFDDYILFWPATHDAPRLLMAVHHALRHTARAAAGMPNASEVASQARRLGELESLLDTHAANGDRHIEAARHSVEQAERDICAGLDSFYRRLTQGGSSAVVEASNHAQLQQEINHLKTVEIARRFQAAATAVQPVREWAGTLKDELSPQLKSARALQTLTESFRPSVLVVDDDEFHCKLLAKMLAEEKLDLSFAASGTGALGMLRNHRPDLIFMDIDLPDIDGVEVTRRIRAVRQFADIPVIMITGHSHKAAVIDSLKAGASDFVVKPFDREKLCAKVLTLLNGGSAGSTMIRSASLSSID